MGVYIPYARLPSAYQEVEWIQSSGTQYIDTGKTVSGDVKIDYIYMPKEYVTAQQGAGYLVFMDDGRKNNAFGSGNSYLYYGNNNSTGEGVSVRVLSQDTLTHDIVSKTGSSRDGGTVWMPSSSYPSPSGNLKLFVGVRSNVITNYYSTRMYSFKRYDSGVLTQDLIPCYRKSDNEIGLYDLVSDTFYTNSGTGTFSKGDDITVAEELKNAYIGERNPFMDYQEVEYIGRNGDNYIDTGWMPNLSNTFEVRIGYKIADSGFRYGILSNYDGNNKSVSFELNSGSETGNKARFYIQNSGGSMDLFSSGAVSTSTFSDVVYKSTTSTKTISVNGTENSLSNSLTGTNNTTAYLFIDRNLRWTTFSHNSFVSYCQIYENGTLVRDFIPCYRKSDNEIGLWDKVNNKFYPNAGTGTFTKGPDVN